MRIVLFTGKGGVGKSTVAAGTAALAAASGLRTLVLSTDAAHSLADAYGAGAAGIGPEPTEIADRLFVHQVDAQLRFEQSWADIQRYLLSVLDAAGMDPVAAEEMTVIPGAEEVLALLELRLHARSGQWDVIVVDCAPTAETLRLLALPEALGWYMERLLPIQRRLVKALRPVLNRAAGVPMPGDTVFDAITRLHAELDEVHALLSGPDASVRLVLTPENVVLAEARRAYTSLSLFGYRVDGVVANRVFPAGDGDAWRAGWVDAQQTVLKEVDQSFPGLPVWISEYQPGEPVGVPALTELATQLYGDDDPLATPVGDGPFRVTRDRAGDAVVHLALPFVTRAEVDLARNGDELVVTVGSSRRLLTLPAALARLRVAGARVEGGELQVRFHEPDPGADTDDEQGGGEMTEPQDPRDPQESGEPRPKPEIGSVGEEALKLFGALADLARQQGADVGGGLSGIADQAATLAHEVNDHVATGSAECKYCPVCRVVHAVRETSPEVRTHLLTAATSLLQAAAGVLETVPPPDQGAPQRGPAVERIDLDDAPSDPDGDQ